MLVWLSFSNPHKPRGEQFLGVSIVEIPDTDNPKVGLFNAIETADKLGINPGGEVRGIPVDPEAIPDDCIGRLMNKNELIERDIAVSVRV